MRKTNLYQLNNKEFGKEVLLDKIEESKYRILEFGKFKPILNGGNIVHNSIAEIFQKYVPEQIEAVNNVIIWRKSTSETWTNYSEIEVKNHLDVETYENAEFDGFRIYQLYYDVICISSSLKDKLISEYVNVDELNFINDWPTYA